MELYKNEFEFKQAINKCSKALGIRSPLIEKDYFVIYLLKELTKAIPGLLFKGGTCCSHAYHVIERFSEDIDLSLNETYFGRNKNIKANKTVVEVCDRLGFRIVNREEVIKHSHGKFNRYLIEYPISFTSNNVKPYVQVEMSFISKSYPSEIKSIKSLITEGLEAIGDLDYSMFPELERFSVCVQKLERTFIDKVFAICDYFELNSVFRNSRHIYDLYKISNRIDFGDESIKSLVRSVRADRKRYRRCVSSQDGYDINATLTKIVQTKFYEADYNTITKAICISFVEYDKAIRVLQKIIDSNLFVQ